MKILTLATLGSLLLLAAPCWASSNLSVDNAFGVCKALDATGILTQECDVSGWNSAVSIKVDMQAGEARQFCNGVVNLVKKKGLEFGPQWQLKIYSPYSGDSTIAFCKLS